MLSALLLAKGMTIVGGAIGVFKFADNLLARISELEKLVQELKALAHRH